MLIADLLVGELVRERQRRALVMRIEPDGHARTAGRNRRPFHVAVREHDPLRTRHLQHFAGHLRSVGITDSHGAARPRIDGRSAAPPCSPAPGVGEEPEHDLSRRANDEGAVQDMGEHGHCDFLLDVVRLRRGRGPRRVCSNSASSFSRHNASSHMRSSEAASGPRADRRAR